MRIIKAEAKYNGELTVFDNVAGYQGENNVTTWSVILPEELNGYWIYVDLNLPSAEILKSSRITVTKNVMEYTFNSYTMKDAGEMEVQIIAQTGANEPPIWKSVKRKMKILPSIGATEIIEKQHSDFISEGQKIIDEAENATNFAKSQGDYAKQQGDYAKEQGSYAKEQGEALGDAKKYADESEASKNSSLESSYQASQHADLAISASEEAEAERLLAQQAKTEAQEAKAETDRNRQIVEQYVTNLPTRYFKKSVAEMEAIIGAKNGDVCYITNFTDGETAQYIYDTMDIDGDLKNPEWLFLGNLPYLVIDRDILLDILQLPTAAISGSYPDLTNKPSRYEPFAGLDGTADTIVWDFSLSCNAYVTLSGTKSLRIINISNGAVGVLKVFGGDITLPSNSEPVPPDFDYLVLQDGQYWEYVFDYDGVNFSWTRRVKNQAVSGNE